MSDAVRAQYETFPYPERNPQDEANRLLITWPEELAQINHYCFRGRQDFGKGFRVLVAGGGTGDATLYLAEQLRETGAQVVYLDMSHASMDIAHRRAEVRKLSNVRFKHGSLLDFSSLGLGTFDYISCTGVLHHLQEPERGLEALLDALAPGGALNIMVYGRHGRAPIYMIQDALKRINADGAAMGVKLARAQALLAALPSNHPWRRHRLFHDPRTMSQAELYDLFLHAQDRAYTVPELYDWIEGRAGLHMQLTRPNVGRLAYQPESYGVDPELGERIATLGPPERAALAELLAGDMDMHCFFATRSADTVAQLDPDWVPFFSGGFGRARGPEFAAVIEKTPGRPVQFTDPRSGLAGTVLPGPYTRAIFRQLDGEQSLGEMFAAARREDAALADVSDVAFMEDFRPVYDIFNAVDGMLLRHRSVPSFHPLQVAQ